MTTIRTVKEWVNEEKPLGTISVNGYTLSKYHSGVALFKGEQTSMDALVCTFIGFYEEEMYAALATILRLSDS